MICEPFANLIRARRVTPNEVSPHRRSDHRTPRQGIANGVGMAIAERILRSDYGPDLVDHRTWSSPATDASKKGSVTRRRHWPARSTRHLTIFYDNNHITIDARPNWRSTTTPRHASRPTAGT